tara:strand:+ start:2279 stop:2812 length:534 start_codon:yes stop_codon:yes gene_type:complete
MYHSESFLKLKELTNSLIDRDAVRVKDIELFRHFLEHSPIKICLWEVDSNLELVHSNCICPISGDTKESTKVFFEGPFKTEIKEYHEKLVNDDIQTENKFIVGGDEEIFMVQLKQAGNSILGAAIEISSRIRIMENIFQLLEECKESNPELSQATYNSLSGDHFSTLIMTLLHQQEG